MVFQSFPAPFHPSMPVVHKVGCLRSRSWRLHNKRLNVTQRVSRVKRQRTRRQIILSVTLVGSHSHCPFLSLCLNSSTSVNSFIDRPFFKTHYTFTHTLTKRWQRRSPCTVYLRSRIEVASSLAQVTSLTHKLKPPK